MVGRGRDVIGAKLQKISRQACNSSRESERKNKFETDGSVDDIGDRDAENFARTSSRTISMAKNGPNVTRSMDGCTKTRCTAKI